MKKVLFYYITLWYILFTFSLHKLDNSSWRLFVIDLKNKFRYCSNTDYKFCVLLTFCMLIVLLLNIIVICKKIHFKLNIQFKHQIHCTITSDSLTFFAKYSTFLCLINLFITLLLSTVICIHNQKDNFGTSESWEKHTTIAHAGGIIDGYAYSNCKEAILNNYQKGYRVFEIDFQITCDNKIVGKHDWEHLIQENTTAGYVPTLDEFMNNPIYGKYTPLSFESLCEIMDTYPDLWIVTDSKDASPDKVNNFFTLLVESAKESGSESILNRVIVQIYNEDMYELVNSIYPFDSYIFTLYQLEGQNSNMSKFGNYARFCYQNDIDAITMWYYQVSPEVLAIARSYGISLYAHTVNDLDDAHTMISQGLTGIYTDSLTPDMISEY